MWYISKVTNWWTKDVRLSRTTTTTTTAYVSSTVVVPFRSKSSHMHGSGRWRELNTIMEKISMCCCLCGTDGAIHCDMVVLHLACCFDHGVYAAQDSSFAIWVWYAGQGLSIKHVLRKLFCPSITTYDYQSSAARSIKQWAMCAQASMPSHLSYIHHSRNHFTPTNMRTSTITTTTTIIYGAFERSDQKQSPLHPTHNPSVLTCSWLDHGELFIANRLSHVTH